LKRLRRKRQSGKRYAVSDEDTEDLDEKFAQYGEQQRAQMKGEDGFKHHPAQSQPIYSPKFLRTLSIALHDGTVRPAELYRMKIPAKVVEGLRLWW